MYDDIYFRLKQIEILAQLDEAEENETDLTYVGFDAALGKFVLITASGSSDYNGRFDEEQFDVFEDLVTGLMDDSRRSFNPSIRGAHELIAEALETLGRKR